MKKACHVMLNTVLGVALIGLAAAVHAETEGVTLSGALPPAGPYMSSRPILTPVPVPPQPMAAQQQAAGGQSYPVQPMMAPMQQMPMQPMYDYNAGMPQQGYRAPMPYGGNMPYGRMQNPYTYPQPSPFQQPDYRTPQGGWRW